MTAQLVVHCNDQKHIYNKTAQGKARTWVKSCERQGNITQRSARLYPSLKLWCMHSTFCKKTQQTDHWNSAEHTTSVHNILGYICAQWGIPDTKRTINAHIHTLNFSKYKIKIRTVFVSEVVWYEQSYQGSYSTQHICHICTNTWVGTTIFWHQQICAVQLNHMSGLLKCRGILLNLHKTYDAGKNRL